MPQTARRKPPDEKFNKFFGLHNNVVSFLMMRNVVFYSRDGGCER